MMNEGQEHTPPKNTLPRAGILVIDWAEPIKTLNQNECRWVENIGYER